MSDQLYIQNDGGIGSEPLTWDGEPLYSPASVQEGLFEADAFSQFRGRPALETDCEDHDA